ncbi:hypothetical protein ACJ41O_006734 [Fusarium nematophilum]
MSATRPPSGRRSVVPDQESVRAFMKECGCSEESALELLQRTNNDATKAKLYYETRAKYFKDRSKQPRPSPKAPSSSPASTRALSPHTAAGNPSDSGASSTYSIPTDTPPTEEDLPGGSSRSSFASAQSSISERDSALAPKATPVVPPARLEEGSAVEEKAAPRGDWDFILPSLLDKETFEDAGNDDFSPQVLARVIQNGGTLEAVRSYLEGFERGSVQGSINNEVEGCPAIFYAVATNREATARLLIDYGADVCAVHSPSRTPLLAFAILNGDMQETDSTAILSVLLSHGASPHVIPSETFTPYTKDPLTSPPNDGQSSKATEWCTDATRARLARATNLTQRYYLERATEIKQPSKKRRQVVQRRNAQGLLGIPFFLVGQSIATELLTQRLVTHLMMPSKRPLVLCFAGPSGHGKTELARQLGHLLSLDLEVVDCTIVRREMELFGPREPYVGAQKGSPVNNFLAAHSGQRCIVFFDEFEKTSREIHQALLLPFDNGEYQDRRSLEKVDCSNTIWILATNALDTKILDFCEENDGIFNCDEAEKKKLAKQLSRQLQEGFLRHFDAPVTGRISDFVPFLPFTPGEQAVITHKTLLELASDLRRPINLSKGPQEQLVGDIRLRIRRDGTLCTLLAQAHYHKKLGARSLKAGANRVERIVADAYLDEDEEIQEGGGLRDFVLDVQGDEIVGRVGKRSD